MPAQIAHCLAAEEAILRVAPSLAESWGIGAPVRRIERSSCIDQAVSPAAWFRLGAQGPDIFYHNQRTMPSGIHYGALAHKRNYGLLVEGALGGLLEGGFPPESCEAAWLLGFATHAALDRAMHPFIVYFSGWQSPLVPETTRYRGCHPFLERLLDLALLEDLRAVPIKDIDLETLLPLCLQADRNEDDEFARIDGSVTSFLARGLGAAFPRATTVDFLLERRIANALEDARYFFRMTNPARLHSSGSAILAHFDDRSKTRSMALLHPDSLPDGLDPGNRAGRSWQHPAGDGRESTQGIRQLFDEGVDKAANALVLVLEAIAERRIIPAFASALGNGGLSITDASGIPVPPRLSRPLPLAEIMEIEYAKRLEQARSLAAGLH